MRGAPRHTMKALAILGVAAILLAACSSSKKSVVSTGGTSATSGGGAKTTVKIGFFGALTGPNAQLGINEYNGAKLAVDQ